MKILFCANKKIGSRLIRFLTWSRYSHACIVDGAMVIEAVWPRVSVRPLANVLEDHPIHKILEFPCENDEAAIRAAYSQVGKPYDVLALFGFLVRRDWSSPKQWFCSELVAWCLGKGNGDVPIFVNGASRITPAMLEFACNVESAIARKAT